MHTNCAEACANVFVAEAANPEDTTHPGDENEAQPDGNSTQSTHSHSADELNSTVGFPDTHAPETNDTSTEPVTSTDNKTTEGVQQATNKPGNASQGTTEPPVGTSHNSSTSASTKPVTGDDTQRTTPVPSATPLETAMPPNGSFAMIAPPEGSLFGEVFFCSYFRRA